MSKYVIDDSTLSTIGDAIRAKSGNNARLSPAEMATAIAGLPVGGEDIQLPDGYAMETGSFVLTKGADEHILKLKKRYTTQTPTIYLPFVFHVYALEGLSGTPQMMYVFMAGLNGRTAKYGAVKSATALLQSSNLPQVNKHDSSTNSSAGYEFDSLRITAGRDATNAVNYQIAAGCRYVYTVFAPLAE